MTLESEFRLKTRVSVMSDRHGAVVSDDSVDRIYTGNEIASYILSELQEGGSIRQIAGRLAARCDARLEDVLPDVEEFFERLQRSGLIVAEVAECQAKGAE